MSANHAECRYQEHPQRRGQTQAPPRPLRQSSYEQVPQGVPQVVGEEEKEDARGRVEPEEVDRKGREGAAAPSEKQNTPVMKNPRVGLKIL